MRLLLWFVAIGLACKAAPPEPKAPRPAAEPTWPELRRLPLASYVPAAGLRWLISARPSELLSLPELAELREGWLNTRLHDFAAATGIALERTEHALAAGFEIGVLYLVDASGWVSAPEQKFLERAAGSAVVRRPHPQIWRVTGLVGSVPEAVVRIDGQLVAFAVRDPLLARLVELRSRGRLHKTKPAFEGAALSALPAELLEPGALRVYWAGPFGGTWANDAGGLLSAVVALGGALDAVESRLRLRFAAAGAWDPHVDPARALALWQALAESPLGRLLGLDRPAQPARASVTDGVLGLDVLLEPAPLVAGAQSLLREDLEQLWPLEGPRPGLPR